MNPTLLYDGHCNLCSTTVRLLLRLDRDGVFRFAPLQSEEAETILARHDLDPAHTCSVVLVVAGQVHTRSEALVRAAAFLPDPWRQAKHLRHCLLYTSPSPRDRTRSRMPSSA